MIRGLGYASYFLTVGDVTDLIREMGVRAAGRGSGAGSLVNYLLGISGVDPIRHGLLMERFLSPLRASLPDIDVDVESARREDIYRAILDRYGGERCVCVSMMDTYRVRHAVRDVGAALGMPPGETDAIAKAFPHIRARDARMAMRDLPELRAAGLDHERLDLMFDLVERLDGLPRHIAVHPCGVLLSDATLLDRTPVESSFVGFPMSQFDKDDVEHLGLLKLDVLGIRMQSSMAHAVELVRQTDDVEIDLDDEQQVPFDDPATFHMISQARTLGVFQIESPGQRELVGKSGIETFDHIITDISLFRPGPVKSDMITPYLEAKHGWSQVSYLHDDLRPILEQTNGVVVFHEQVIEMIAQFAGITNAEADEKRRALGDTEGMAETKLWFFPVALGRGYSLPVVESVWKVIEAFASFGFCKAHAAAFALPTYQSAWLKAHWPAHFLAGVLTHDPGMYPKRLILEDARQCGIAILGLDVNASEKTYVVERMSSLDEPPPIVLGQTSRPDPSERGWPDGRAWGIRLALAEVKGINAGEIERIVSARPYHSLTDFWHRAQVSRPIAERLVLAGGFDSLYGLGSPLGGLVGVRRRTKVTRRDLLLQVAELDRHARAVQRAGRARGLAAGRGPRTAVRPADTRADQAAERASTDPSVRDAAAPVERHALATPGVWARAAAQSRAAADPRPVTSVQLTLDLGDEPQEHVSGLPEMSPEERMRAELEILGLDASRHVVDTYADFLDALGAVRSRDLLTQRSRAEILVAGVKVATQTPPVRSGRRVVFLTLDDGTGPVDATFFEDAQGPYAATVFGSWLLVVRGELRRTGHRGVSLRATGAWSLPELHALWGKPGPDGGIEAVRAQLTPESALRGAHPSPGAGALQRLPDVSLRRRQAGRRGRQGRGEEAVAPQPREPRMTHPPPPPDHPGGRLVQPLGWRPWRPQRASDAAAPGPPSCGPRWSRCWPTGPTAGSTSSTSAAAPAAWPSASASSVIGSPWSTPAPTRWPPSTAGPTSTTSRSPAARATCPACSTWPAPTAPTWCCATASSRSSTTPPPRWRHWRAWSGPGECSASWSPSATPPWSPGPWPVTSSRRSRCSTPRPRRVGPDAASPTTSSPRWCATPGSPSMRCRASGCSPTSCPVRCSTSSPAPPRRWSSWSRPWPPGRSTSRWPPSSTCSPTGPPERSPEHGPRGVAP